MEIKSFYENEDGLLMSTPPTQISTTQVSAAQSTGVSASQLSEIITNVIALVQNRTTPSVGNILSYAIEIMQNVEKFAGLTSAQKLQVLQSAIGTIINNSSLGVAEKEALQLLVPTLLPEFAKIVCLASKGILAINQKIENSCKACCSKC